MEDDPECLKPDMKVAHQQYYYPYRVDASLHSRHLFHLGKWSRLTNHCIFNQHSFYNGAYLPLVVLDVSLTLVGVTVNK